MEVNDGELDKVTDIVGTLVNLNRGNFVIEAGRKLTELTEACARTRKKGVLTIKLEVLPTGINQRTGRVNQFELDPEVSIKKPELSQPSSIFFFTENGTLTRDDPDQMEMDLQEQRENARNA